MHYKHVTARHSALDAESPKHNHLFIRGLLVMLRLRSATKPAMTNWHNLSERDKQYKLNRVL